MFWEALPWFQLLEAEQWKRVKFTSFTCCAVTALLAPSWKRCHAGTELPALTAGPQQGWGAGTQLALPGRELTKVVGMHRHHQSLLEKHLFGEESRVWGKSYFCNWSLHLNSSIIVFKITQNFILFAQSPVKIMWHLGTVFGKWEMLLSRHVDVPVCLWPNEWELKWKITASIAVWSVWVVFLFSCPVPNFPCNSFRRPRVINSVIQGCYSYSERFLDSWDLAFTLVLPLPVRLRSIILQNHLKPFLKSSEHRTGFLELWKNIYFAQENSLKTISLFLVTCVLYQPQLDVNTLTF